jgi:hypothetical protein
MQHLSPPCTILGSWVRLYNKEHDWVGSTFRWFDLCKFYNEVVVGWAGMVLFLDCWLFGLILVSTSSLQRSLQVTASSLRAYNSEADVHTS